MKKCPDCGKLYDDSWEVCMKCDNPLSEDLEIAPAHPELKDKPQAVKWAKLLGWPEIKSEDDVKAVIGLAAAIFVFTACLQIFMSFYLRTTVVVEGFFFLMFAIFLLKFKSRVCAVVLLVLSILRMVSSAAFVEEGRIMWAVFSVATMWAAIIAVRSTFKVQKVLGYRYDGKKAVWGGLAASAGSFLGLSGMHIVFTIIAANEQELEVFYNSESYFAYFILWVITFLVGAVAAVIGGASLLFNKGKGPAQGKAV